MAVRPPTEPAGGGEAGVAGGMPWFAVSATVLAGLAPLLLVAATPDPRHSPWRWALLLTVLAGLRYSWLVAEGPRRTYELVFWLFTYAFMCLAPLVQLRTGRNPGTTPFLDHSLDGRALVVVGVGAAAFAVGSIVGGTGRRSQPAHSVEILPRRLRVLTTVALLFAALYVLRVGPAHFFSSRTGRNAAEQAAIGNSTVEAVVKAAATLPLLVAFAGLTRLRRAARAAGGTPSALLPLLVLLALAVVVNPLSSPRYVAGTAALAILTSLGGTATIRRTRLFSLLLAAGLVLVFPYADATRRSGGHLAASAKSGGPATALTSSDFDAFAQLNNGLSYVRAHGHTGAGQLEGAALFFVPRTLWSGKPEDTGILLADFRGYQVTNLSAPAWVELYLAGGLLVVVGGMGALGYGFRRLDRRAVAAGGAYQQAGLLSGILPFYVIIMLRGSLLQSMAGFVVLGVCARFVSHRLPPAAPLPVSEQPG